MSLTTSLRFRLVAQDRCSKFWLKTAYPPARAGAQIIYLTPLDAVAEHAYISQFVNWHTEFSWFVPLPHLMGLPRSIFERPDCFEHTACHIWLTPATQVVRPYSKPTR